MAVNQLQRLRNLLVMDLELSFSIVIGLLQPQRAGPSTTMSSKSKLPTV
jgi:hypothetical protein